MLKVGILGLVLLFVGHVDEQIETMRFQIAGDDRQELLFMKEQQFLYGFAKHIQQAPLFGANCSPRRCLVTSVRPHSRLAQTSAFLSGNRGATVRSLTDFPSGRRQFYANNIAKFLKVGSGPAHEFIHVTSVFLTFPNELGVFVPNSNRAVNFCAIGEGK
jgi:hypothetical protein